MAHIPCNSGYVKYYNQACISQSVLILRKINARKIPQQERTAHFFLDLSSQTIPGSVIPWKDFFGVNKTFESVSLSNNKDDVLRIRSVNKRVQIWRRLNSDARHSDLCEAQSSASRLEHMFHTSTSTNSRSEIPTVRRFESPIDPFSSSGTHITVEVLGMLYHFTESL
jgi:hypothetical protein